jgi:hypothetical protein
MFTLISIPALSIGVGLLGYGPFGSRLFQESMLNRIAYWKAGSRLFADYILTGVGFDKFGDYFKSYRPQDFADKFPTTGTNSTHNLFLDLAISGGLLIAIPFFTLSLIGIFKSFWILINSEDSSFVQRGIVSAWIGYFLQSLINPFNIAIALPGWILLGFVLSLPQEPINGISNVRKKVKIQTLPANKLLQGFATAIITFAMLFPFLNADLKFTSAAKTANIKTMSEIATSWPYNEFHLLFLADYLLSSNMPQEAVRVAKFTVTRVNQNSSNAWKVIAENSMDVDERTSALNMLRKLGNLQRGR